MEELPDVKTEVTPQEMALALWEAYHRYFNSYPKKDSIKILLAQWALETGWGKSMHCYNVGNAKCRPNAEYNWCYFKCNEILPTVRLAEKLAAADPDKVKITKLRSDGTCIVWFYPKHPWCCFKAFKTLEDGAYDHLKMVVKQFGRAWTHAVAGDPVAYSRALKKQGYYTADEASYTRTLKSVFDKLDSLELPEAPLFSEEERKELLNRVALSIRDMTEKSIYELESLEGADEDV